MQPSPSAPSVSVDQLLAVVEVDPEERVFCQQPGCGHTVYKRIHVVSSAGKLLVLGSTCFDKAYGGSGALGGARFGGKDGRRLTPAERLLLQGNTAALLAQFEAEARAEVAEQIARDAEARARQEELRARMAAVRAAEAATQPAYPPRRPQGPPGAAFAATPAGPWPWARPLASMAYFKLRDGTAWVRVTHRDGRHFLAPYPVFEGWDEALPSSIGVPDLEMTALAIGDLVAAVAGLRRLESWDKVGSWKDINPGSDRQAKP